MKKVKKKRMVLLDGPWQGSVVYISDNTTAYVTACGKTFRYVNGRVEYREMPVKKTRKKHTQKFYIRQATKNEWYWHLKAGNGKIIANGEGYHNRQDCLSVIKLVDGNNNREVYEIQEELQCPIKLS